MGPGTPQVENHQTEFMLKRKINKTDKIGDKNYG